MATTLITMDCKPFQMMPYIIILKVRKFHEPTANRFSTARKKTWGGNVPHNAHNVQSLNTEVNNAFKI